MPAPLMSKDEVVTRLSAVFRDRGYEGASLARLSAATGLGKASLYHYFPGGKADMAAAVLAAAGTWLERSVIGPLRGPGPPAERIGAMVRELDSFYGSGRRPCLIGVMAIGESQTIFQESLKKALRAWIEALTVAIADAGIAWPLAAERAEDAVLRIQGALIVARGLNNSTPFRRLLYELPRQLLPPVERPAAHP